MASPRADSNSTPICRCRVLYLGSSVPHITKDGLQGIQEPLRELYPDQGASGARGIDSWLSVWSNGLLLENVDENHKKVTRFFPIDSLHYCAAVRYVLVQPPNSSPNTTVPPRFLPLDSPFARNPNAQHPPLFAAILRRTTGIKVLECHAFICKREMAANALVKCCFHAYADASYAKQIDGGSKYSTLIKPGKAQSVLGEAASSIEKVEGWRTNTTPRTNGHANGNGDTLRSEDTNNTVGIDDISIYNGDENHKVWATAEDYSASTLRSVRSMGGMRSARPRQIIAPAKTPPPPPLPMDDHDDSTLKKNKKLKNKNKNREEFLYGPPLPVHYNGVSSLMRPMRGPHSVNGTMMRPNDATLMRPMNGPPHPQHMNGYGPPPPPPHMVLIPGRPMPPQPRMIGTFSHRPKNMRGMPPPFLGPPPPQMMSNTGRRPMKHYQHQEEPIYMPSNARPLSPGASYHPGNFPIDPYVHPMLPPQNGPYVPQNGQYVPQNGPYSPAAQQNGHYVPQNGPNGPYSPQNGPYPPEQISTLQRPVTSTTKKSKKSKKSDNNMDDGTDSPFNTGIYRKKGHLNERAFSYSIRQEHRSRSYGSLASLKFSENGSPIVKEDSKKEREIMQMMQDLELSGDELQHSPGAGPAMNGGGNGFEARPRNAAAVGRR